MKKIDLSNIVKDKLTGKETGELVIKDRLSRYISWLKDEAVRDKEKPPRGLLPEHEIKNLKNKLRGDYNIDAYNKHVELLDFLRGRAISQMIWRAEIEAELWKLSFLMSSHTDRSFTIEELVYLTLMIYFVMEQTKHFFFIQAIIDMAIETTKIQELSCLKSQFPYKLVECLNEGMKLTDENLPLIEPYKITHEDITGALAKMQDMSDLYNEEKLMELLKVSKSSEIPPITIRGKLVEWAA